MRSSIAGVAGGWIQGLSWGRTKFGELACSRPGPRQKRLASESAKAEPIQQRYALAPEIQEYSAGGERRGVTYGGAYKQSGYRPVVSFDSII